MTKPIILVKICYNVSFKELHKVTSWPQLISNLFGRTCLFAMMFLIGPALFYIPGVFVYTIYWSPLLVSKIVLLIICKAYIQERACLKLKLTPTIVITI